MTPERWQEVKSVLGLALDSPTPERGAVLDRACGADAALRREVEALLAHAGDGTDGTSGVGAAIAAEAAAATAASMPVDDAWLRALLSRALGDRYDMLRPLGQGGMGAVYLAWERALERFVAIKVLRPDLAASPESRERFRREARIAAQLAHPGILPLHTFGEVGGVWFFVMGYVRGESLAERLRRQGPLPHAEARRILVELADALACAHRHGVVHRDIKPDNVLLDEESGHAVLADFGISKLQGDDRLTASGVVLGTPRFMSPEQAGGAADVDERSDVYSLGAVGYTMLAGHEPFAGATPAESLAQRLTREAPSLHDAVPAVPEELATVVMRCLARDPARRWPDARSLKAALDGVAAVTAEGPTEALRDLSGFGPYALAWALGWSALAALTTRGGDDGAWLLLVALLVPVGLGLHVWNVERHGLTPLQFARVAFWPPRWWGMWWPHALRRPGDLWGRLPWQARLVRRVVSAFVLGFPTALLLGRWLAGEGLLPAGAAASHWGAAAELGAVLCVAAVAGGALAWALRRGLSAREAAQLLFGATVPSAAWRAPRVARLLAPAGPHVRPPERDAPADHARAIAELVRLLPAEAAGAGADAERAAHRLAAAILQCEQAIAALERDASTAELDRLAAHLAALEAASLDGDDDRRELRELVRHQLELLHRMRGRREVVLHQRSHLLGILQGLWVQLSLARDAAASTGSGGAVAADAGLDAPPLARVRALCLEAADQLDAYHSAGATRG